MNRKAGMLPQEIVGRYEVTEFGVRLPELQRTVTIRLGDSDVDVFRQCFLQNQYDSRLPAHAGWIIDAGANVGFSTLWLRARFPAATIIALEPDPDSFRCLLRNCAGDPAVIPLQAALWNEAGMVGLQTRRPDGTPLDSWGYRLNDAAGEHKVATVDLATLIARYRIPRVDVLKVDIEGAEKEVFEALDAETLANVGHVMVEAHDRFKPGSTRAIEVAAERGGFSIERHRENLVLHREGAQESAPVPAATKPLGERPATSVGAAPAARPPLRRDRPRFAWVLSDARSGSTWMAEMLNHRGSFRRAFEPMHALKNPKLTGEPHIPVLAPGTVPDVYRELYGELLERDGHVLIKDIHAMLSAPAILPELGEPAVMLCLVRDPVAVAASKLRLDMWRWMRDPAQIVEAPHLLPEVRALARDPSVAAGSQFEKYVLIWCVLYKAFRLTAPADTIFAAHSRDIEENRRTVREVFDRMGLETFDDVRFTNRHSKRSAMDGAGLGEPYEVSEAERDYARRAVAHFGLADLCPDAA